jgi:hypothetical protein
VDDELSGRSACALDESRRSQPGAAGERHDCACQPPTAASSSTEAGADDVADTANPADNATRHRPKTTSDRTRSTPNGLRDCSADRGKALAYPPNYSEREASSAPEGVKQPQPHGSYSSTGTRSQPLEPCADIPGEGDDHTSHPAERVAQVPQHGANRT